MVAFGDPPNDQNNDPLLRNVFGGNAIPPGPLGGQTDYVYDFLDKIWISLIPSKDQFGGDKQGRQEGEFVPGDEAPEAAAGGYVCVTEPNDPEDQPPDESCWCVWMREDSIAQQGLGPIFKTREACVANCHCNDEDPNPPYPDPSGPPPTTPPITNMCIETSAMKVLEMEVIYKVVRDPGRDGQESSDPNHRWKAYKYSIEITKRKWRKASLRDCVYINSPEFAGINRRRAKQMGQIKVHPTLKELQENPQDYELPDGSFFYDIHNDEITIYYDVKYLFQIGPTNCNTGCIDFESTNDLVFYDFCGGGNIDRDDGRTYQSNLLATGNFDARMIAWRQGMVGINYIDNNIWPVGYGPLQIEDPQNPGMALDLHTSKESILVQTLFNLNPSRYGSREFLKQKFADQGSASWVLNGLSFIGMDYCIEENNEVPSTFDFLKLNRTSSKNYTKIIGDPILLSPDLNYLYKMFNTMMYWPEYGEGPYPLADTYPYN